MARWLGWLAAAGCAHPGAGAGAAAHRDDTRRVAVVNAGDPDVVPGARIALYASSGQGDARETLEHLASCAEVVENPGDGTVTIVVPEGFAYDLASIPADAVLRAGVCASTATPRAAALRPDARMFHLPEDPASSALASIATPADSVVVFATFTLAGELQTATLFTGAWFVSPPDLALAVSSVEAEVLAHVLDAARVQLGVEGPLARASRVPPGTRLVAGALPEAAAAHPFAADGDLVDLTVAFPDTAATFARAVPMFSLATGASGTVVGWVATPDDAEKVLHVLGSGLPLTASLRAPDEPTASDGAPPDPEPPIRAGLTPADKIGLGMRAVAIPSSEGAPEVGTTVDIVAADGTVVLENRVVLAVARGSVPPLVLVMVTPQQVRQLALDATRGLTVRR